MKPLHRRFALSAAAIALTLLSAVARSQTVLDSPELYAGEKQLYEAAQKEGLVVSFDTGPTWANWAAEFAAFKKRYPEVEIVYNDIGSAPPSSRSTRRATARRPTPRTTSRPRASMRSRRTSSRRSSR